MTRLLAEVVLRPPDIRHLDAAFQVIAASPHGTTSLKAAIDEMFATHCATCGRSVVADDIIWESDGLVGPRRRASDPQALPVHDLQGPAGGGEQRHAPVDEQDRARAEAVEARPPAWRALHDRFPILDGNTALVDQLLALHTPRQLVGLYEILQRIDGDLRAAQVEAASPARVAAGAPAGVAPQLVPGAACEPADCRRQGPRPERRSVARAKSMAGVRGCVPPGPRVCPAPREHAVRGDPGAIPGGPPSLAETPSATLVRLGAPATLRSLAAEATRLSGADPQPRVRLVVGQPPIRPSQDRLSFDYYATSWVLGHDATTVLPLAPLFRSSAKLRWGWQAAVLKPSLEAIAPLLTRDARVVLAVEEGGQEAVVATVLGAVAAGYRLVAAQLDEPSSGDSGLVEFIPPGATRRPGPRTRANQNLPATPGGAGDPEYRPSRGLFAPSERVGRGPFSPNEAAQAITETALEILKARGEPAGSERLLGEILVGLDAGGHLRRLVRSAGLMAPDSRGCRR